MHDVWTRHTEQTLKAPKNGNYLNLKVQASLDSSGSLEDDAGIFPLGKIPADDRRMSTQRIWEMLLNCLICRISSAQEVVFTTMQREFPVGGNAVQREGL